MKPIAQRRRCRPAVEGLEGRLVLSAVRPAVPVVEAPPSAPPADPAGDVIGVTDPSIIHDGGAFYVFSSGVGVPILRSTDLTHWQAAGQVFAEVPAWAQAQVPGAGSIWAPDISYFGGAYHLYYAVSRYGTNRSVIGLATNATLDASSPLYRWVDRGEVIASRPGRSNWNAIDPQVTLDASGTPWLVFGSQWSGIKLAPLDPSTGKLLGGRGRRGLVGLAHRPGARPIEAPYLVRHDGAYYLFASFDLCCQGAASTYKIMVGRSSRIGGPYVDREGRPMSRGGGTLVLGGEGRYRGPGHNAVLTVGGRSWLVYHTYDALNAGTPRLQIRPLSWGADGWPVVGAPLF
jgi:arabinan endo-1,5-alpha-L-arabinosidase